MYILKRELRETVFKLIDHALFFQGKLLRVPIKNLKSLKQLQK
jgi:hypothetical protein